MKKALLCFAVAAGLLSACSTTNNNQGGVSDESPEVSRASPTMRPGMDSRDIRDATALTRPEVETNDGNAPQLRPGATP